MTQDLPEAFLKYQATYGREYCFYPPGEPREGITTELEVAWLWYWLIRSHGGSRLLETGTYIGFTTCLLAAAVRDNGGGEVYTIDPQHLTHLWEGHPLEGLITWLPATSQEASGSIKDQLDVILLDSLHTYAQVAFELAAFEPLLVQNGLLLFHDSLYHDGVGLAIEQLVETGRFEHITLDTPRKFDSPNTGGRCPVGTTVLRKRTSGPPLQPVERLMAIPEGIPAGPLPVLRAFDPMRDTASINSELQTSRSRSEELQRLLDQANRSIHALRTSTSWRITAPLRALGEAVRNKK